MSGSAEAEGWDLQVTSGDDGWPSDSGPTTTHAPSEDGWGSTVPGRPSPYGHGGNARSGARPSRGNLLGSGNGADSGVGAKAHQTSQWSSATHETAQRNTEASGWGSSSSGAMDSATQPKSTSGWGAPAPDSQLDPTSGWGVTAADAQTEDTSGWGGPPAGDVEPGAFSGWGGPAEHNAHHGDGDADIGSSSAPDLYSKSGYGKNPLGAGRPSSSRFVSRRTAPTRTYVPSLSTSKISTPPTASWESSANATPKPADSSRIDASTVSSSSWELSSSQVTLPDTSQGTSRAPQVRPSAVTGWGELVVTEPEPVGWGEPQTLPKKNVESGWGDEDSTAVASSNGWTQHGLDVSEPVEDMLEKSMRKMDLDESKTAGTSQLSGDAPKFVPLTFSNGHDDRSAQTIDKSSYPAQASPAYHGAETKTAPSWDAEASAQTSAAVDGWPETAPEAPLADDGAWGSGTSNPVPRIPAKTPTETLVSSFTRSDRTSAEQSSEQERPASTSVHSAEPKVVSDEKRKSLLQAIIGPQSSSAPQGSRLKGSDSQTMASEINDSRTSEAPTRSVDTWGADSSAEASVNRSPNEPPTVPSKRPFETGHGLSEKKNSSTESPQSVPQSIGWETAQDITAQTSQANGDNWDSAPVSDFIDTWGVPSNQTAVDVSTKVAPARAPPSKDTDLSEELSKLSIAPASQAIKSPETTKKTVTDDDGEDWELNVPQTNGHKVTSGWENTDPEPDQWGVEFKSSDTSPKVESKLNGTKTSGWQADSKQTAADLWQEVSKPNVNKNIPQNPIKTRGSRGQGSTRSSRNTRDVRLEDSNDTANVSQKDDETGWAYDKPNGRGRGDRSRGNGESGEGWFDAKKAPTNGNGTQILAPSSEALRSYLKDAEQKKTQGVEDASWRGIPDLPSVEEIEQLTDWWQVPNNKLDGPYSNSEEYLKCQYDLLRLDATEPYRDAVQGIRLTLDLKEQLERGLEIGEEEIIVDRQLQEAFNLYEKVTIEGVTFAGFGLALRLDFTAVTDRNINWQAGTKRLLPGSVLLMADNPRFEKFWCATIVARPLDHLSDSKTGVDVTLSDFSRVTMDSNQVYWLLEAKNAYYEAYRHILNALQSFENDFPMCEQIVRLDPEVAPPKYFPESKEATPFDMHSLFRNPHMAEGSTFEVGLEWPTFDSILDSSQLLALKYALNHRLSMVVGPPGTGKTFTSTKLLQVLLDNQDFLELGPILIITQTNHALDQLLEHMLHYESAIVRLGSRVKSEAIRPLKLYDIKQKYFRGLAVRPYRAMLRKKDKLVDMMKKVLEILKKPILGVEMLVKHGAITQVQSESLDDDDTWVVADKKAANSAPPDAMTTWLDGLLVRFMRSKREAANGKPDEDEAIDAEALEDQEKEYRAALDDEDDHLKGDYVEIVRHVTVRRSIGLKEKELGRWRRSQSLLDVPRAYRAELYLEWESKVRAKILHDFNTFVGEYNKTCAELKVMRWEAHVSILARHKIIGMTSTGLSKYRPLVAALNPKIALVEEAAEVLEAHVTAAVLPSLEHLILVGDHLQLRPSNAVHQLAEEKEFNVSLFERLTRLGVEAAMLKVQRRMRPEIRSLISPIYEDQLLDHEMVQALSYPTTMTQPVFFLHHDNEEEHSYELNSKYNPIEADWVANFAIFLIKTGVDPTKITILTMYSAQRNEISRRLNRASLRIGRLDGLTPRSIHVSSVDGYQGEENDIILLSLVRNNETKIGFLASRNRVNVALSRARKSLYVFGNAQLLAREDDFWSDVIERMDTATPSMLGTELVLKCPRHQTSFHVETPHEFETLEGGCHEHCDEMAICGRHRCPIKCHPFPHRSDVTSEFEDVPCRMPCDLVLDCGLHRCRKDCHTSASRSECQRCEKCKR